MLLTKRFPRFSYTLLLCISFLLIAVVGCTYNYTSYVSARRPFYRKLTADSFVVRVAMIDTARNEEIESIIVDDLNEMSVRCITTKEYNAINDTRIKRNYMALKINQSPSDVKKNPQMHISPQSISKSVAKSKNHSGTYVFYFVKLRFNLFCTPTLANNESDIWHAEFWSEPTEFSTKSLVRKTLSNYIYQAIVKDSLWIEPRDRVL